MKQAPKHLLSLVEPVVEGLGYECVGIEYNPHPRHGLLRVYIDTENGVLLEDCTKVSHQLSGVLDVESPISTNYELEVSSPGIDRPLFKLSQFKQFLGKMVTINLFKSINQQRKITGIIEKVESSAIILRRADQVLEIPFQTMSKARLVPNYLLQK